MKFSIGVPKEIKSQEKRVGLTPEAVKFLVGSGQSVLVESEAGLESGYSNQDYLNAGAQVAGNAKSLYAEATLIQKVKEPLPPEYSLLRKEHVLFCFLHLASQEQCKLVEALMESGCTAIGYETFEDEGRLPILAPMSHIAGGLSAVYAAFVKSLSVVKEGSLDLPRDFFAQLSEIAAKYPDVRISTKACETLVFGGGVAGMNAAEFMASLGGNVCIVEINKERRDLISSQGIKTIHPDEMSEEQLKRSEVLIGSAHSAGKRAVKVLSENQMRSLRGDSQKVLIDIAIDQGGNFPGSRSTSYERPLYLDEQGNLRFCVPNLPSLSGQAASIALSEVVQHYSLRLSQGICEEGHIPAEFEHAINIKDGKIMIHSIREVHRG